MSTHREQRKATGLTQTDAARKAGVSLATWRRWEADAGAVSSEVRARCERVIEPKRQEIDGTWREPYKVWHGHPHLPARHAAALSSELAMHKDLHVSDWLDSLRTGAEPLKNVPPFCYFDPRVMFHVGENAAWAEMAAERSMHVSRLLGNGAFPHAEWFSCLYDQLIVVASIPAAAEALRDMPELYAGLEEPEPRTIEDEDEPDGVFELSDDDIWEDLAEWLRVSSRYPIGDFLDPPAIFLPVAIQEHHPFTWFDSSTLVVRPQDDAA